MIKTSLTKIGNSKGIIIPASVLKMCELEDEVLLEIHEGKLIISNSRKPREGWEEAFNKFGAEKDDLIMEDFSNDFDQEEWSW